MPSFDWFSHESFDATPGSPKIPSDDFRGIQIAVPSKNAANARRLPVCGSWVFSLKDIGRWNNINDSFIFLIREVASHRSFCGHFRIHKDVSVGEEDDVILYADDPEAILGRDPADFAPASKFQKAIGGYFNFDLFRLFKIAEIPAHCRLTIVLDEFQSNEVEFELLEPEE